MSTITQLILELDGHFTLQPDQHLRLRQRTGSSTTIGSRIKVGILGERHPGLNSCFFFFFRDAFSLAGNLNSLAIDGEVDGYTCRTPHFLMHSPCTALRTDITHKHGSSHQGLCHFTSARQVPCLDAFYTKDLYSVLSCSGSSNFNPLRRSRNYHLPQIWVDRQVCGTRSQQNSIETVCQGIQDEEARQYSKSFTCFSVVLCNATT